MAIGDIAIYTVSSAIALFILGSILAGWAKAGEALLARISPPRTWRVRYHAYLRSEAWQAKRRAAITRAGHRCQNCGGAGPLDVHHLTYERLGHEHAADLRVLCEACHEEADRQRAAIGRAKRRAAWALARARGLAQWRRKHA